MPPNNNKSSSKASLSHALTLTPLLAPCSLGWTQARLKPTRSLCPPSPVQLLQSLQQRLLGSSSPWLLLGWSPLCQHCCNQTCPCGRNICPCGGQHPWLKRDCSHFQPSTHRRKNYISSLFSPLGLWLSKTSSLLLKLKQTLCVQQEERVQAGPHKTMHGSCMQMHLSIHDHTPPPFLCFAGGAFSAPQ